MSGEIHNVQISLTQIPRVQKLNETQMNSLANQGHLAASLNEARRDREKEQVRDLDQAEETEAEDPKKRHEKKARDGRHIDISV